MHQRRFHPPTTSGLASRRAPRDRPPWRRFGSDPILDDENPDDFARNRRTRLLGLLWALEPVEISSGISLPEDGDVRGLGASPTLRRPLELSAPRCCGEARRSAGGGRQVVVDAAAVAVATRAAQPCQGWGRGFESHRPLQTKSNTYRAFPARRSLVGVARVVGLRELPASAGWALIHQLTLNQRVQGSSPCAPTTFGKIKSIA